jgi:diacylglycerol kinase family enzyme
VSHVSFAFRRRAAAIGALLALSVGLLAVARGFAESPFAILLAFFALLAAIGFGWVALTARGEQRNRAAWVAVGLLAIAFIAAVGGHSEGWSMVLGGFAIASSLPLGRYALGVDRRSRAQIEPPGIPVDAAHKPVLLINPRSGDGKAKHLDLMEIATARGIECHRFGPGADLGDLTRAALAKGADVVGVAGGDGSLGVVADLVSGAGVQMVCIPAGTRNHFAMDLGLDRGDPVAALDAFGPARLQTVDIARVNGTAFLNNVSMGIYGGVVQSANYRERKLETTIDALPTLVENPPDLRFIGPDGLPHTTVHVVHVSNNPYLMELRGAGGRPRLDTGKLGIVTVELSSPAGVTDMLARAALGLLNTSPDFSAWTGTRFEVDSDRPIAAGVDGEAEELHAPAVFEIQPGALQVRIPLAAVGRSPAAFVPQVRQAVAELLRRAFLPVDHWRPLHHR